MKKNKLFKLGDYVKIKLKNIYFNKVGKIYGKNIDYFYITVLPENIKTVFNKNEIEKISKEKVIAEIL